MLSEVAVNVIQLFDERGEQRNAEPTGEGSLAKRSAPPISKGGAVLSIVQLEMLDKIEFPGVLPLFFSARSNVVGTEMILTRRIRATQCAHRDLVRYLNWTIWHARIDCFMLFHVPLPPITREYDSWIVTLCTPMTMYSCQRRRRGSGTN